MRKKIKKFHEKIHEPHIRKHRFRFRIMATVVILFAIIFMVMFNLKFNSDDKEEISNSLDRAYSYLDSIRDPDYVFNDDYLKYIYPSENLDCAPGYPEDCVMTYRKLDAYFDLVMIRRVSHDNPISDISSEADSHLSALIPVWKDKPIYNTLSSEGQEGLALDTFCILGYMFHSREMAENVMSYLQDDNWMADDYYKEDKWRNIADESWCVMLFTQTQHDNITYPLISIKIKETDAFLEGPNTALDKTAVLIHMIKLLVYDSGRYKVPLNRYIDELTVLASEKEVQDNTLLIANILDIFLSYNIAGEENHVALKDILISRQAENGAFYPTVYSQEDNGQAFTTMRAIIALEKYSRRFLD